MDDSVISLRNRTVGRNTASSYRDLVRIRPSPYPLSAPTSPTRQTSPRRTPGKSRRSPSPPKRPHSRPQAQFSDRFIPHSSSPVSLRHILSSPPPRTHHRDGSQSPTNPQLHSPGKEPEWPNSFDDTLHAHRLASALELPISPKLLSFTSQPSSPTRSPSPPIGTDYFTELLDPPALVKQAQRKRSVPPEAYRVLDAPELRDDYYAQQLSWSTEGELAVALGPCVFLWNPADGVRSLQLENRRDVTNVVFNSTGEILAVGLEDGGIWLQGPEDEDPRVYIAPISPGAIGALAWRPTPLSLQSDNKLEETLSIGTATGAVVLLLVVWDRANSSAEVKEIIARWDNIHNDQICGIAWSKDGLSFATGANDNKVCTYEVPMGAIGVQSSWEKKFEWIHDAAVKGLAFKSGKGGILAAGGGVHDKKIRFYNTHHGTLVSSLDVSAQITTLLWSPSSNEILATFGYTAMGISTKCAVYAYPSLQCLFSFEIADETRALYAVPSPCGRDICLAGSDECIRFYRIWGDVHQREQSERWMSPVCELLREMDGRLNRREGWRTLSVIR